MGKKTNKIGLIFLTVFLFSLIAVSPTSIHATPTASFDTGFVAGDLSGKVHFLAFNGLSAPTTVWSTQLPATFVQRVNAIDLDLDGESEILAAANNGKLYCLEPSTGTIRWDYTQPWADFSWWKRLFISDVDIDGYPEIITGVRVDSPGNQRYYGSGGGIIVLEHTGAEKCRHQSPVINGWNGNGPDQIALGDLNEDGVEDIASLYGSHLYPYNQPRIQVLDVSTGLPIVLTDFRYTSGGGMTSFVVDDIDTDGKIEYVTAGWWCPVIAFENYGAHKWTHSASGGNADRHVKFAKDINGIGQDAIVIGTGAYYNAWGHRIYIVNPVTGSNLVTPTNLPFHARNFNPRVIVNIDGDAAKEIIAFSNIVGTTNDKLTAIDGQTGTIQWHSTIDVTSRAILSPDLDQDGTAELLVAQDNGITLIDGSGAKLWTHSVGSVVYALSLVKQPPIEDIDEETITQSIQSADMNGDGIPDYTWKSSYEISFVSQVVEIEIDIKLVGADPGDSLRQQWEEGIECIWSNSYDIVDGIYTYPIEVEINWVDANPHHVVVVHSGLGRANMIHWFTESYWGSEYQDEIAAHEVGHMLGLYDEYLGGALDPDTHFITTNSLMADLGPTRNWHYEQILDWLETKSGRDLSLAQSPLPPYQLDEPIPNFIDPQDRTPPELIINTPMEGQAIQDGITFSISAIDESDVDWVNLSIREPNGDEGIVIDPAFEKKPATNIVGDEWQLFFDTTLLPDGYYLLFVEAIDVYGYYASAAVDFSIRNWAVLELLPQTVSNQAGRTMPVKFALRVIEAVDPAMPFVWNEELTIIIYDNTNPSEILQISTYGAHSKDYRIEEEHYITNFKTSKTPATYVVELWRKDMLIGYFTFETIE
jgi:outer membrane protein assembly factor BamB